ncbi:MAG: helix-turn-helix transcriptional regulator [Bacteroidia bacterium]|nr:helix-turn-helix transcriptional regulator [Bacteroidia bacterium]
MSRLPETIRRFRKRAGLRQAQVAAALQISPSAYSALERGISSISRARLQKIARILGCNTEELLAEAEIPAGEDAATYPKKSGELDALHKQADAQAGAIRNNREIIRLLRDRNEENTGS